MSTNFVEGHNDTVAPNTSLTKDWNLANYITLNPCWMNMTPILLDSVIYKLT